MLILLVAMIATVSMYAQDSVQVNSSVDVVSRFIFRGANVGGESSHIQPVIYADYKGFEVSAWGSYGISNNYTEVDLSVKYTYKSLSVQFTNYNIPTGPNFTTNTLFNPNLSFNFGEIGLYYNSDLVPINAYVATNVYGDNLYSTYVELSTVIPIGDNSLNVLAGITPYTSIYGNPGLVNIGAVYSRNVIITDSFSVPTKLSCYWNPQTDSKFLVVGITF